MPLDMLEADLVGLWSDGVGGGAPRRLDTQGLEVRFDRKGVATRRPAAAIVSSNAVAFAGGGALQYRTHILVSNSAQSPINRISAWRHGERGAATDESLGLRRRGPSKPSSQGGKPRALHKPPDRSGRPSRVGRGRRHGRSYRGVAPRRARGHPDRLRRVGCGIRRARCAHRPGELG